MTRRPPPRRTWTPLALAVLGLVALFLAGCAPTPAPPPNTTPFMPETIDVTVDGASIEVHVTGYRSACETFSSSVSGPDAGGGIEVALTLVHTGEPICILVAVPVDETITIGPLPAGSYVARVAGTEWPVTIA